MAMKRFGSVDEYIDHHTEWTDGLAALRRVIQTTDLDETLKWSAPCYTHEGKIVVGLLAFKSYFGLWFHQGVLLADTRGVLINAQKGKTKAMRQWRFASAAEVKPRIVKSYVVEAIGLARDGREVKPARGAALEMPPELASALKSGRATKAFEALTPGKQREYANHIAEAKRDATKLSRVEKILPLIKAGVGLNDKYRNC